MPAYVLQNSQDRSYAGQGNDGEAAGDSGDREVEWLAVLRQVDEDYGFVLGDAGVQIEGE